MACVLPSIRANQEGVRASVLWIRKGFRGRHTERQRNREKQRQALIDRQDKARQERLHKTTQDNFFYFTVRDVMFIPSYLKGQGLGLGQPVFFIHLSL